MSEKKLVDTDGTAEFCDVFIFDAEKVNRMQREITVTEGMAPFFKALADDTRLKIIYALSREELCVCDVATMLGSTVQTASHHLRLLRNIGMAKCRRDGKIVFYSLKDERTASLIRGIIETLKGVKQGD